VAGPNLRGFTVAITADRRRDEQAVLMERLGVEVLMFPLLRTEPEDPGALRALTEEMIGQPPDYLLANTGYGMRTWLALAAGWGRQEQLVAALRPKTAIAARGAKALGEVRKAGLDAFYKAPGETLEEVVARLSEEDLAGKSVVVQLHGEPPGETVGQLERAGAKVSYLPVYRMGGGGAEAAGGLVETLLQGAADVVTFTAAPQVEALTAAAATRGVLRAVLDSFNGGGVVAACIGPVCAAAALAEGISMPLVPEHPRLGSLTSAVGQALSGRQVVVRGRSGPVALSGRAVEAGEGEQRLVGAREQKVLRALGVHPGDWVDVTAMGDDAGEVIPGLANVLDGGLEVAGGRARLIVS
jgi:uroporphyrinogen-III synthase